MRKPQFVLRSESELREVIGQVVKMAENKKLSLLEPVSKHFIAHSPLFCMATRQPNGRMMITAHGGQPGFVQVRDAHTLVIPYQADQYAGDLLANITANQDVGLIFLIPNVNETLRINGKAQVIRDPDTIHKYFPEMEQVLAAIQVQVEENYLHCAKAFLRSRLWDPAVVDADPLSLVAPQLAPVHGAELDEACQTFIRHAPFLCLGSQAEGGADVSPRGDPRGFVYMPDRHTLVIPDRPGNKIADNFRNLLENPQVGALFFIPGSEWLLSVSGRADITTDPELLAMLAVEGKTPLLALWVAVEEVFLAPSTAIARARLWDPEVRINRKAFPTMGEMMAKQLEFAGSLGEQTATSLDQALDEAYRKRLY